MRLQRPARALHVFVRLAHLRRLPALLVAIFSLTAAAATAQSAGGRAPALALAAGEASSLALSGPVRDIVVGDPRIADVSVINDRTLVILGKQAGVTTLQAFDAAGRPLVDRRILVAEASDAAVTVQRGAATSSYACPRLCSRLGPISDPAAPAVP